MTVHSNTIRNLLPEFGWVLVEARTIAYLWVAEIWLIQSTWSPNDCRAYLTFEIDGQYDSRDLSHVWAIRVSISRPDDWAVDEELFSEDVSDWEGSTRILPITKEKDLESFFAGLAMLRNEFAVKTI